MTVIDPLDTYIPFSKQITGFIDMLFFAMFGVILMKLGQLVKIYCEQDYYYYVLPPSGFLKILGLFVWVTYLLFVFKIELSYSDE